MRWLSDTTVDHLRVLTELPDFEGTRYRLEREIGRGGMGIVYLAEDTALKREVAIKVLSTTLMNSAIGKRMLREAMVIARLEHPGIVPVHDAGILPDGRVFYVMKLVRGNSLGHEIERLQSLNDRLRVLLKACEAVAFAHANGVIHRDLKPDNIMLGPFGEVLVMDWGTAKLLKQPDAVEKEPGDESVSLEGSHEQHTDHGVVIGTPAYMAPEQARGDEVDARSDIYSLGAVLLFLLSPKSLLETSTLIAGTQEQKDFLSGVASPGSPKTHRPLNAICEKAMAANPHERYASVEELASDISRFLDGEPVSAYRENIFEKIARWVNRHRFLVLLVLAYLLMRVLLLFVSWN